MMVIVLDHDIRRTQRDANITKCHGCGHGLQVALARLVLVMLPSGRLAECDHRDLAKI